MIEHLLIGDIGALLIVLGLTGPMIAPLLRIGWISRLRVFSHPLVALPVWAVDLYVWHIPLLYKAALRNEGIHALEHACFLLAGIAMWMALLGPLPKPAWFGDLGRLGYIIAVRLIEAILGNVFLWSHAIFYPYYRVYEAAEHISPLQDQITAGAIMMVEGWIVTLLCFGWLFARAASQSDQRQALLDYARRTTSSSTTRARRARWRPGPATSCAAGSSNAPPGVEVALGPERVAQGLEARYGISVEGVFPLDEATWRVVRSDGGDWVARVFPAARAAAAVAGDAAILALLERLDYPAERCAAPDPVAAIDGDRVLVTGFVAPVAPSLRRQTIRESGGLQALGELLAGLALTPVAAPADRPGGAWHHLVDGGPAQEIAATEAMLDGAGDRVADADRAAYDSLRRALRGLDDGDGLPTVLVDPDFVLRNVVASRERGLVLVDWAGAGVAPRAWALAWLLYVEGTKDLRRIGLVAAGYARRILPEREESRGSRRSWPCARRSSRSGRSALGARASPTHTSRSPRHRHASIRSPRRRPPRSRRLRVLRAGGRSRRSRRRRSARAAAPAAAAGRSVRRGCRRSPSPRRSARPPTRRRGRPPRR